MGGVITSGPFLLPAARTIHLPLAFLPRFSLNTLVPLGETGLSGAEGATAPETLRQKDQRHRTDSGEWRGLRPPKG